MKTFKAILITGLIGLNTFTLMAQNAPVSTLETVETYNDTVTVSITVDNFTNIGASDLLLVYDPAIAKALSIELAPGIGSFFFVTSVDTLGKIYMSWLFFQYGVPGLTLEDGSEFLIITFARTNFGVTSIEFDDDPPDNCLYTDEDYDILNDIPYADYYINGTLSFNMYDAPVTSLPTIDQCAGLQEVDIPVSVFDFEQVGAFELTMQYNPSVFMYQSFTINSGYPDVMVADNGAGTIVLEGFSIDPGGVSLPDNSVLLTLHFTNQGGSTALSWFDDGVSCLYSGPAPDYEPKNDNPQSSFYIDGSFTELPWPAAAGNITGPSGGMVCKQTTGNVFSVAPIAFANSYHWSLPEGATIESGEGTPEIVVSFNENALNGDVSVYGINDCGNGAVSPVFPVTIETAPAIELQPVSPDTVYSGNGIATFEVTASGTEINYQWQELVNSWTDITDGGVYSGTQTAQLTITNPLIAMNGNAYRCVVTGFCDPPAVTDGNAILTVVLYTGFPGQFTGYDDNLDLQFKSYPNPFSNEVSFSCNTPSGGLLAIEICTINGAPCMKLTSDVASAGKQVIRYHAHPLKPGVYHATLTFKNEETIIKNTLKIISRSD